MRALVIEHGPYEESGFVGDRLVKRGWDLVTFATTTDMADPVGTASFPDRNDYDALVVMGSIWSVYDEDRIGSWIGRELEYIRTAHDSGQPVLGICFGGQVLSAALGGEVSRARTPEYGWIDIDSDEPDLLPDGPWFQWHIDRFTVPEGAEEIARTANAPQAFRVGRSLGVQFHPEVGSVILKSWLDLGGRAELEAAQVDPEALVRETIEREAAANQRSDQLVDGWLDHVAEVP